MLVDAVRLCVCVVRARERNLCSALNAKPQSGYRSGCTTVTNRARLSAASAHPRQHAGLILRRPQALPALGRHAGCRQALAVSDARVRTSLQQQLRGLHCVCVWRRSRHARDAPDVATARQQQRRTHCSTHPHLPLLAHRCVVQRRLAVCVARVCVSTRIQQQRQRRQLAPVCSKMQRRAARLVPAVQRCGCCCRAAVEQRPQRCRLPLPRELVQAAAAVLCRWWGLRSRERERESTHVRQGVLAVGHTACVRGPPRCRRLPAVCRASKASCFKTT